MNEIQKYIAANEPQIMEDLFSLIRIPSISALPEHHDDMLACAERWAQLLLEAGVDEALVMPSQARLGEPISSSPSKINFTLFLNNPFLRRYSKAFTWMKDCPLSSSAPRAQIYPSRISGSNGWLFHNSSGSAGITS